MMFFRWLGMMVLLTAISIGTMAFMNAMSVQNTREIMREQEQMTDRMMQKYYGGN